MLQTSSHLAERTLLRPSGTLCHFSLDPLRDALAVAVDAGTPRVVVDLAAVELLSAAAVGLLLEAAARLEATGGALVVTGASGLVAEVLGLLAPELAAG